MVGKTLKLDGLTYDRTRHGKVRWFYRDKRGKKQMYGIHDEPPLAITEAVMEAYRDAQHRLDGDKPTMKGEGTLGWLIERYMQKRKFDSDLTRADYRSVLGAIQESDGHRPFATMRPKHVEYLRDKAATKIPGNKRVKKLRLVFDWAIKQELMTMNPARGADLHHIASTGYTPWTRDDVLAFETRHPVGSKARLALALFLYTGQRKSDVVQWGPLNDRDGRLVYIQHKGRTRKVVRRSIPIIPPLRSVLSASPVGNTTWLETEYGKPFSIKGFGSRMRAWCDQAGLHNLSAHGIRKATGIIAAERGCTGKQIMEILGVTLAVAEEYCREADKIRLADDGFARAFGGEE